MARIRAFMMLFVLLIGIASRIMVGIAFADRAHLHVQVTSGHTQIAANYHRSDMYDFLQIKGVKAKRRVLHHPAPNPMVLVSYLPMFALQSSIRMSSSERCPDPYSSPGMRPPSRLSV